MGVDIGRVGAWATDFEKLLSDPVGLRTFTVIITKIEKRFKDDEFIENNVLVNRKNMCNLNILFYRNFLKKNLAMKTSSFGLHVKDIVNLIVLQREDWQQMKSLVATSQQAHQIQLTLIQLQDILPTNPLTERILIYSLLLKSKFII